MSLLGTLQVAQNSLIASQIGLQVAGNNVSNANTPGYIRQEVIYSPATTQLIGDLPLGLGVRVEGIVQQVDRFLSERLRGAVSDLENSSTQEQFHLQLESILGELGETDLSSSLTSFFATVNDVLNQPEDIGVRQQAVLQGEVLLDDIQRIDRRVLDIRSNLNDQVVESAREINRLLDEVANLNVRIVQTEGDSTNKSEAVGLRDQREVALQQLAGFVGIRVVEQLNGAATVFVGGDYLVFDGEFRPVSASFATAAGGPAATVHIESSDSPLASSTGKLAGIYAARDEILGSFNDQLAEFTATLAFEFNKVYSSGQGLSGFTELTAAHTISDDDVPLDQAGLAATPVNGSFQVQVRNTVSGLVDSTDLIVDLNGLDNDTTLLDLVASLDAIEGLSAELNSSLQLQLRSDSADLEFAFANDTSGVLAALGLNVFFAGSELQEIQVHSALTADAGKFAASSGGVGHDAENAVRLAALADAPLESHEGNSIIGIYKSIVSETAQASAVSQAVTDGFRVFQRTLEGQHLGISGVSIDDEAVKILTHQRVFQASARIISTISELLATLINL